MRYLKLLGGLVLATLLTACGGGGGSAGTTSGSGGTSNATPTSKVADFALFTDKTSINNSGSDSAKLTVVAVDSNRNAVSGATVTVVVDQNALFVPTSTATDGSGSWTGTVQAGSDKSDREITVSVTINGITKKTSVRVAGTRLTLQATPSVPSPGQTVTLQVSVTDSSSNPVPNVAVALGGSVPSLQTVTLTTNASGIATRVFVAPTTAGSYAITASGNGVIASEYQLQVFASSIPAAVIPAGAAPSLSASPNVLSVNSVGSTANKSTLKFLFLDPANKPVQNVRVRFVNETTGLAAVGATISTGSQTVYTDASGSVTAQYISGQNSSPTNGVTVKACYSANDFASATDCPASVSASLTVAGQALAVSVGDDNLISKGSGTYIKKFAVTVADSAGRAVPNAPVDISVDLTHYGKGEFEAPYVLPTGATTTFALNLVPTGLTDAYPSLTTDPITSGMRIWCPNEDTNRNGNVDPGENIDSSVDGNGQPTLEPRKSDLLISYDNPTVTTTDANGVLVIKVEYSQRFGTWLAYKVRVTANVAGSQGMAERTFVADVAQADVANGSFRTPPYGVRSCSAAN